MQSVIECMKGFCSLAKIDRENSASLLNNILFNPVDGTVQFVEQTFNNIFIDNTASWESRHGALLGAKTLVVHDGNCCTSDFKKSVKDHALRFLEDNEHLVRLAAGAMLGALCKVDGENVYISLRDVVIGRIKSHLDGAVESPPACCAHSISLREKCTEQSEPALPAAGNKRRTSKDEIFTSTASWKFLETWLACLQCMVEGCGYRFNSLIDAPMFNLIGECVRHHNRFVRDASYNVLSALLNNSYSTSGEILISIEESAVYRHGEQFASMLALGMSDSDSQVRLSASIVARRFLLNLPTDAARRRYYSALLPPLCINRYYAAQGVRLYNQETWRQVTAGLGRQLVENYIDDVVPYYIQQTSVDDYEVREAACTCIAELANKLCSDVVRQRVPVLFDALIPRFADRQWTVRDAACSACGIYVVQFPAEFQCRLETLYPLFFYCLEDYEGAVRMRAAIALANVVKVVGSEALALVTVKLKDGLKGVESQSADSQGGRAEQGIAMFTIVQRAGTGHGAVPAVPGQLAVSQTVQCQAAGLCVKSTAPVQCSACHQGMSKAVQSDRTKQPWRLADGCVCLMSVLSQQPTCAMPLTQLLPQLARATSFQHYPQHVDLLETVCKQLPVIFEGLGKRALKLYADSFFDAVFYAAMSDVNFLSAAGNECVARLRDMLGENILRGRLEKHNPRYLDYVPASSTASKDEKN